jgi:putative acetyltransferase
MSKEFVVDVSKCRRMQNRLISHGIWRHWWFMTARFHIVEDDLTGDDIAGLLRYHLDEMHHFSPPCIVHAMPIERLREPDVSFWSAWDGDRLAACGALKQLDARHGEIKSMRAAPGYRGKGAGREILRHLLAEAKARGYGRVSLETGSTEHFLPARGLYAAHGFTECGPFGAYMENPFSIFMSKAL